MTVAGNITLRTGYTIAGSSAITCNVTATFTSNGKTWPNGFNCGGIGTTKTWADAWTFNGILNANANGAQTWNGSQLLCTNGITMNNTADVVTGTASIRLTGGTWGTSGVLGLDCTLAGNITISSATVDYGFKTLTYESGTITTTGSTMGFSNSPTLNTAGMVWNNVTFGGATNDVTLTSLMTVTGSATIITGSNTTFQGTHGFDFGSLICQGVSAFTYGFKEGITYLIRNELTADNSRTASRAIFTSTHASTKAIITLMQGATCSVNASLARIDASAGRTINTFTGVVTDCLNIRTFSDLQTVAAFFL